MKAGLLREIVTLESETRQSNGQGGFATVWSGIADGLRAEIIGLTGDESINAAVERSVQRWRVTMRTRNPAIVTKQRLIWKGLTLNIKSAVPDPKDRAAILLICESTG